jgi:hypothetical protein
MQIMQEFLHLTGVGQRLQKLQVLREQYELYIGPAAQAQQPDGSGMSSWSLRHRTLKEKKERVLTPRHTQGQDRAAGVKNHGKGVSCG